MQTVTLSEFFRIVKKGLEREIREVELWDNRRRPKERVKKLETALQV